MMRAASGITTHRSKDTGMEHAATILSLRASFRASCLAWRTLASLAAACVVSLPAAAATSVTLSLVPSAAVVAPGEPLDVIVRLDASTPAGETPSRLLGVQCVMTFDTAALEAGADNPIVANESGPFAMLNQGATFDGTNGTIAFFVLDGTLEGFIGPTAEVARLKMRVRSTAAPCGAGGLVRFATVAGNSTQVGQLPENSAVLSLVDLPPVSFDRIAPALSNIPSSISQPADAGRADGAVIPPPSPAVSAADGCDPAPALSLLVTFPGGSTATAWPAVFPVGTTSVRWTARDASGNESSATRFVVVQPFQLLDASVRITGQFDEDGGPFTRTVRIRIGGATFLRELEYVPFDPQATAYGLQIPVTTMPVCVTAKDPTHSLTDSAEATVVGTRYAAEFALLQGDSNDDDVVDILDFSMFVLAFGQTVPTDHPSNFNADIQVTNADFGPIAIHYFRAGESCGAIDGAAPRGRVSVKDLRRAGLGHLAAADLNHDGWIDQRDVQMYLASGMPAASAE